MAVTYTRNGQRELLEELGFNWLTGEACAFSLRILFDLNQDGVDLLGRALGIRIGDDSPRNMNSRVNGLPAIKSCMLSWPLIDEIVKYALAERHALNGEWVVLAKPKNQDGTYTYHVDPFIWAGTKEEYGKEWLDSTWQDVAWTSEDGKDYPGWVENENPDTYRAKNWEWRTIVVYNAQPHVGGRNVHAMSGRYE